MRLSISNIAWDPSEDEAVAELLGRHKVDAIDVAPGKYFKPGERPTHDELKLLRGWWADRGIEITGMQALLFGTEGLNVFGKEETQTRMLEHLEGVCRIGAGLGATRLVFGSPKNRDRHGLSADEALHIGASFFWKLAKIAWSHGVVICLEPNPPCYGANWMTDAWETAMVVNCVSHPGIRMTLDTGACAINKEDVGKILEKHSQLIGHIHASEPELKPLWDIVRHTAIGAELRKYWPERVTTIEMLATKDEPHLQSIERALLIAKASYK